jgi:glucokinase
LCARALDCFAALYGATAGNVALLLKATGGVYIGGGIAPKILEKLKDGTFMRAFLDKGRLTPLLETIRVQVVLNDKTALLGAARVAARNR